MSILDTRRERASKQQPITTLGNNPGFKAVGERVKAMEAIDESRRLKSLTDSRSEQPHAARIEAERPYFMPTPEGFEVIERKYEAQGIRVLKSEDDTVVALQFADNRRADKPEEKAVLHALEQPEHLKFTYQPKIQIWTREDNMHTIPNIRDAIGIAGKLAKGREGLGR